MIEMVSDSLLDFVEKRYSDLSIEDMDELKDFLDKEKYLTDNARDKLFEHFESNLTIEDFGTQDILIAEEYFDEDWDLTGKQSGKIGSRVTWKYTHELYERGDTQWVMLRDRKTGHFKKRLS